MTNSHVATAGSTHVVHGWLCVRVKGALVVHVCVSSCVMTSCACGDPGRMAQAQWDPASANMSPCACLHFCMHASFCMHAPYDYIIMQLTQATHAHMQNRLYSKTGCTATAPNSTSAGPQCPTIPCTKATYIMFATCKPSRARSTHTQLSGSTIQGMLSCSACAGTPRHDIGWAAWRVSTCRAA